MTPASESGPSFVAACSSMFRTLLLSLGILTGPINAVVAMAMGEDQRAIAIALLSLVAVQAATHFGGPNP